MKFRSIVVQFLCVLIFPVLAQAQSSLVQDGASGLVYAPYANEGQANAVNTVPDFSRAGYQGGGVPIPFVPVAEVINPLVGDDTVRIQEAIDTVSNLPLGPDGFRGAVLLTAGDYIVSSTLQINASGVVIRGEGQDATGGTRISYTATTQSDLFHFHGSGGPDRIGGSARDITDSYVPVGARTLSVTDASGFSPGDMVRVTNTMNQAWINAIGMTAAELSPDPAWEPSGFQLEFYRYITSINGNELTLDAPIVQAIETQYGGGKVERFTYADALENVGIEAIRLESSFSSDTDEEHGWRAIEMQKVLNGWVRQVTSRYFGMGLVYVDDESLFVTVEDSAALDPKSITTGGRKYSFQVDDSSYVLVQRCLTRGGRHDYVSGSRTPGPNVFTDSLATEARDDIGPHFRYATGELYDNISTNNTIRVQNRLTSGTSHGWSGAQIMFWNTVSGGVVNDAPTGAMNWAIGVTGAKQEGAWVPAEPFGIWESRNTPVQPRSLYLAQLRDRLGAPAVAKISLPSQQAGTIWTELSQWDGDGLFLDPVVAWVDLHSPAVINVPVPVGALIRDLKMMEDLSFLAWGQLSGPATVSFADDSNLETTVNFSVPGQYELQLIASDGARQWSATLIVNVTDPSDLTPPAVPTGLAATPEFNSITLDWDDNGDSDLLGYSVYRRETGGSFGPPLTFVIGSSDYADTTAVNGTIYDYAVTASDVNGNESARSDAISASPDATEQHPILAFIAPAEGAAFTVGSSFQVEVEASDLDGSIQNVALYLNGQLIRAENAAPYEWTDAALQNLIPGNYHLEAVALDNDAYTTRVSLTFHIVADTTPPGIPSGLAASSGDSAVGLDWIANPEADLASYSVYRRMPQGEYGDALVTGLPSSDYLDITAVNEATYFYSITAVDNEGNESLQSAEVSATPRGFIDFGNAAGKILVSEAGFSTIVPNSGSEAHDTDAYRLAAGPSAGHENFAFLKTFAGVGNGATNDFTLTLEARLFDKGVADKNNYRYGLALFNEPSNLGTEGINAILLYNDDKLEIHLRDGLEGDSLVSKVFKTVGGSSRPYDYPEGETYAFEVTGTYTGDNNLVLNFTLGDGTTTDSVSTTVDASLYSGSSFGGAARIRDGFTVDFDSVALAVEGLDAKPASPAGLFAAPGNGFVQLSWADHPEADVVGYNLYRSTVPGDPGALLIADLATSNVTDFAVVNGTTYYYRVAAVDLGGNQSDRSPEALATPDVVASVAIPASDNSFVRNISGIQDASERLTVKRGDWNGPNARLAYIRIPIGNEGFIGGIATDSLQSAELRVFLTSYQTGDTLRVYALEDEAQFSGSTLSETTWTGGADGTVGGGHILQGNNRPDGDRATPNDLTTLSLGSLTLGVTMEPGLKVITIAELEALKTLLENDSNGEITLIIEGTMDGDTNEIASVFNTSGTAKPSFAVTGATATDTDGDGIADSWEGRYFDSVGMTDGALDSDADGVADFFEYLTGTDPTNSADAGSILMPGHGAEPSNRVVRWTMQSDFTHGENYLVRISTDLSTWDPMTVNDTLTETVDGANVDIELELSEDHGDRVFIKLIQP